MDNIDNSFPTDALSAAMQDASNPGQPRAPTVAQPGMVTPALPMEQQPIDTSGDVPDNGKLPVPPILMDFVGKEVQYGTVPQQIITGIEGAANAASFGFAAALEKATGVPDEDVLSRRQINPNAHLTGQIAGLVTSNLIPVLGEANDAKLGLTVAEMGATAARGTAAADQAAQGVAIARSVAQNTINPLSAASIMAGAGRNASEVLGLGKEGAGFLSQIGAHTVQGATEMALLQGGDEISKAIISDPEQSANTAIANIGMSAAMGAAGGAVIGTVSPLIKAVSGSGVGQELHNFIARGQERLYNIDPVSGFNNEMSNAISDYDNVANGIYGDNGLKGKAIEQHMPQLNIKMLNQYKGIADDLTSKLGTTLKDDPLSYKIRNLMGSVQDKVYNAQSAGDIFDAMEFAKRRLHELSSFSYRGVIPVMERDFVKVATEGAYNFRAALEDESVWGKVGNVQRDLNSNFSKSLPIRNDIKRRFMQTVGGEQTYNPAAGETYINQLGSSKAVIKQDIVKTFMNNYDDLKGAVSRTYDSVGVQNPYENMLPRHHIEQSLKTLTPGAKLFDSMVRNNLSQMAGKSLGAVIGGGVGHATGIPGGGWVGGWLGNNILGPFLSSVMPVLAKPLLTKAINAESFMAASEYGTNITKGTQLLNKATKSIFSSGAKVMGTIPADKKLDKFDQKLKYYQQNPEAMINVGGQIGHYLPDHASAIAQTVANASTYLNGLRPSIDRQSPLDTSLPADPVTQAKYKNALMIAENPYIIMDRLREGTLTHEDVGHLSNLYPGFYNALTSKLMGEMTHAVAKKQEIPYKVKIGLSMLMAQPLDSTMTQPSLAAIQTTFATGTPNQQLAQAQSKVGRPKGSMKNINKLGTGDMTKEQARESAKSQPNA